MERKQLHKSEYLLLMEALCFLEYFLTLLVNVIKRPSCLCSVIKFYRKVTGQPLFISEFFAVYSKRCDNVIYATMSFLASFPHLGGAKRYNAAIPSFVRPCSKYIGNQSSYRLRSGAKTFVPRSTANTNLGTERLPFLTGKSGIVGEVLKNSHFSYLAESHRMKLKLLL